MHKKLITVAFVALSCATGCSRRATEAGIPVDPSGASKAYTADELSRMVIPGMSLADVTNKFGLPATATEMEKNEVLLNYFFSKNGRKVSGVSLEGFGVQLRARHVERWFPITTATPGTTGEDTGSDLGEQVVTFAVPPDRQSNVVDTVRAQGYAEIGNLKDFAGVTFKAHVYYGMNGTERAGEKSVFLEFDNKDASKLTGLTENRIGQPFLVIFHDTVIAAPVITGVLNTNQFEFTVSGPKAVEILRGK